MVSIERSGDWWDVPTDPHPATDLGYDLLELDVIETSTDSRPQLLVLPADEDLLRGDAFLVVDEADVCDLESMV
jgi:hypothetical protein